MDGCGESEGMERGRGKEIRGGRGEGIDDKNRGGCVKGVDTGV